MKITNFGNVSLDHINKVLILVDSLGLKYDSDLSIENMGTSIQTPYYSVETRTIYIKSDLTRDLYQQVTYQFAHEIMHHIVYFVSGIEHYDKKKKKANEILCCAFALFVVFHFGWIDYLQSEVISLTSGSSLYSEWANEIVVLFKSLVENIEILNQKIDEASNELIKTSI